MGIIRERMGYTQIDEPGLLPPVDHIDLGAENALGRAGEVAAVAGLAQGVGPHGPHPLGCDAAQQLGKTGEAIEAALDGLLTEPIILEPGAQLNFFGQRFHRPHFTVLDLGYEQVEGVAAKIQGCEQAAV